MDTDRVSPVPDQQTSLFCKISNLHEDVGTVSNSDLQFQQAGLSENRYDPFDAERDSQEIDPRAEASVDFADFNLNEQPDLSAHDAEEGCDDLLSMFDKCANKIMTETVVAPMTDDRSFNYDAVSLADSVEIFEDEDQQQADASDLRADLAGMFGIDSTALKSTTSESEAECETKLTAGNDGSTKHADLDDSTLTSLLESLGEDDSPLVEAGETWSSIFDEATNPAAAGDAAETNDPTDADMESE